MNKFKFIPVIMVLFAHLNADSRIILYLRTAPQNIIQQAINEARKDLTLRAGPSTPALKAGPSTPGHTSRKQVKQSVIKRLTPKLSGFFVIYSGYMDVSDRGGLISFPLRHATPKIYLAITEEVNLIKVRDNTIAHREFLPQNRPESALYCFERKEDVDPKDPTKKTLYWHVQEMQLPEDNKINPLTLVILSKKSNIYVPVGDFMASESVHMVLPDIYVIGNKNQEIILFQTLDIRRYFETINTEDKKIDDKKSESLIKNI